MIDLTPIINAAIVLLAGIITAFVIPWVKAYVLPWIEANTTEKQRNILHGLYKTAVFAAEQVYGSGYGQEKLEYAKNYIRDKGYTVDYDMIEATVKEHFGHLTFQEDTTDEEEAPEEDEEPQTPDEGGQRPTNESESADSPSVASAEPGSVMAGKM